MNTINLFNIVVSLILVIYRLVTLPEHSIPFVYIAKFCANIQIVSFLIMYIFKLDGIKQLIMKFCQINFNLNVFKSHQKYGYFTLVFTFIHGLFASLGLYYNQLPLLSIVPLTGFILTGLYFIISFEHAILKNKYFELFKYSHYVLNIAILIILIFHAKFYVFLFGIMLGLKILNEIIKYYLYKIDVINIKKEIYPFKIIYNKKNEFVEKRLTKFTLTCNKNINACLCNGSYFYINIPEIAYFEYHPFSTVDIKDNKIDFIIDEEKTESFTNKMCTQSISNINIYGPFYTNYFKIMPQYTLFIGSGSRFTNIINYFINDVENTTNEYIIIVEYDLLSKIEHLLNKNLDKITIFVTKINQIFQNGAKNVKCYRLNGKKFDELVGDDKHEQIENYIKNKIDENGSTATNEEKFKNIYTATNEAITKYVKEAVKDKKRHYENY